MACVDFSTGIGYGWRLRVEMCACGACMINYWRFLNHQINKSHFASMFFLFSSHLLYSQIYIFSGSRRFTSDFDLCAANICSLHIRIVAMGCRTVSNHRMRQRHIDRCVGIHIDCTISRTVLCHRESTQKIAGEYSTWRSYGVYGAHTRATHSHFTPSTTTSFI